MADDKVSLCRLWRREGRHGEYFVGRMGGARVLIFRNLGKTDDSEHDVEIFVVNATDPAAPAPKQKPPTRQHPPRDAEMALKFQAPVANTARSRPGPAPGQPHIDELDDDVNAVFDRLAGREPPSAA